MLKLILIIFINKTYALITRDNEIILLPTWNPMRTKEVRISYGTILFITR